jgi:biopolymer transport protein ExbB
VLADRVLAIALLGADWVLWVLVGLSFLCLAVAGGRVVRRLGDRDDGRADAGLAAFAKGGSAEAFAATLAAAKGPIARVLAAGLDAAEDRGADSAEEVIAAALGAERARLDTGLAVLATTGSNAPFIGLFGTVLGIIRAFHDLSLTDASAAASVMSGISEALVSTAVGLLVAIPAVVSYNIFARQNKSLLSRAENRGRLLLSRYKGAPRAGA